MSDEPCIKRELESPTPKRQRLSSAQDMFELIAPLHQYSPPPSAPSQGSPQSQGGVAGGGPHSGGSVGHPPHHHNHILSKMDDAHFAQNGFKLKFYYNLHI